jgi:hypothetical protein
MSITGKKSLIIQDLPQKFISKSQKGNDYSYIVNFGSGRYDFALCRCNFWGNFFLKMIASWSYSS